MELKQINDLINELASDKHFKDRLGYFYQGFPNRDKGVALKAIYGWENWMKMELLYRMAAMDIGGDYWGEDSKGIDGRSARGKVGKTKAMVDICYRRSNEDTDVHHAIELKIKRTPARLVRAMEKDLRRIEAVAPSHFNFRSITAIGICSSEIGKKSKLLENAESVTQERIPFGGFHVLVFHWESDRVRENNAYRQDNYRRWLKGVTQQLMRS